MPRRAKKVAERSPAYGASDFVNQVFFHSSEKMPEIPDESIQVVITSPPYWNVKDYSKDGVQKKAVSQKVSGQIGDIDEYERYLKAMTPVWRECHRVLKPGGKLCVNVPLMPILKRQMNTHSARDIVDIAAGIQHEILHHTEFFLYDVVIWNRTNPTKGLMFGSYPYPPNFYIQNTIEFITLYVKDGETEKRPKEIREASKLTQREWVEFTKQVWDIPIPNRSDLAYGEHPAIMPEEIVRRLIRLFSFSGDVVLDPFMGSGTTAKVAMELNRFYTGYEINPAFKKLIDVKTASPHLFSELLKKASR